ncbi:MAG: putative glycoside hydrolase, partial [Spirochaetota bacterium]
GESGSGGARDTRGADVDPPSGATDEPGGTALDAAARRAIAANQTGIYLAPQNATMERLPDYFDYLDRHGLTSIVVDFKDDLGRLTYASELEAPRAAGAVTPLIEPRRLVEAAHARGFYVIARVVVFKDPKLWAYDNHRYAIWDRRTNGPWAVYRTYTNEETGERRTAQVEQWVDAYSPEVWQYNVDIAREIAGFGVDEIQFDYIRFPSDGFTDDIQNRYYVEGADRVQALEGFLSAARDAIDLPVSIDVFGFNAWARMNYLGQDITRLARYVDVISPMFYPSHFARPFLPQFGYLGRAEIIYDAGTRRAREMANTYAVVHAAREQGQQATDEGAGATLIRPYIQAFLIGSELEFDEPTYRRYLDVQVEASLRAEASGYTLWNASGRYYMLP